MLYGKNSAAHIPTFAEQCAAQKPIESAPHSVQQLQSKIAALAERMLAGPTGENCYIREYANELRQLSAVQ